MLKYSNNPSRALIHKPHFAGMVVVYTATIDALLLIGTKGILWTIRQMHELQCRKYGKL